MEPFNESSNDASNQMKPDYFYNDDSNLVSSESKIFDSNGINNSSQTMESSDNSNNGLLSRLCYCGKERNLELVELQCAKCLRWYHEQCISVNMGKLVKFMTCYTFLCKLCSGNQLECFTKRQTTIANLIKKHETENRIAFSKDKEIIPFIEANWDILSTMPRRVKNSWHNTVHKMMMKDSETFMCDNRDPDDVLFALRSRDLYKIAPNYDNPRNFNFRGDTLAVNPSSMVFRSRNLKKKLSNHHDISGELIHPNKRQKSELFITKLPPSGFPAEFPFNKDSYRYFLAEIDSNAPYLKEFEESQEYAGKPIPGWICRKIMPEKVLLSMHDRAPQLKISEDRRSVTGEKGYCMIRANYGVTRGVWYYEVKITEMPDNSATRIGWSQELANLQTPLGYDKFGYSWRSKKGTKFHESIGKHYAEEGYGLGDVLGCLIDLPHSSLEGKPCSPDSPAYLPKTYKDKQLIKFKSFYYFEEKDEPAKALKALTPRVGSRIVYYKNGVPIGTAFEDIYHGTYFPAAGLYKNVTMAFNFGPNFEFPPTDDYGGQFRGMNEAVLQDQVEQSMADMLYLVENEHSLKLDLYYKNI